MVLNTSTPSPHLCALVCVPSLPAAPLSPSPCGEAGDIQVLTKLNGFQKQYLWLHVGSDFVVSHTLFPCVLL